MNGNHNNHMSGNHGNGVMGINGRNMNGPNGMKTFDRQGINGKPQRHVQSTYSPQPRTSFDTTPERPRQEIAQRMVTSMYDPSSVGSGPVLRVGGGGPYGFELSQETGGKGNKPRKGLKGLFGGHKAGRLA
ncbi:hypothetical protein TREMEDRAFT_57317 [Tremella mesenterica DSM 1558]|uniref:uncharacterized protein n=1 Tax=Tremella mesenterica (strain ATCC 24925 / CBS 8224 / DSM 1558 / NBRC 9311 / NRRL Y-6157 / RJB 2259-6 / UBC 559-6) TaxID=578456 RepID=UPI0003F4A525|nr:uncharacterized protein TREMEDRAFT_57317 [Tremella mesenterica DSM 1558]EIW68401.1 hypothetical protein TREMEDRAFT_57317 [Tremella mesenterica DSM 1558]